MICFTISPFFCPSPCFSLHTSAPYKSASFPLAKKCAFWCGCQTSEMYIAVLATCGKRRVPCSTASPHRGPPHFWKGPWRRGRKRQFHFRPKSNDYWSKKKRLPSISMGPGSGPLIFIPRLTTYEEGQLWRKKHPTIQAFSPRSFHSLQRAHQNLLVYVAFEFAS